MVHLWMSLLRSEEDPNDSVDTDIPPIDAIETEDTKTDSVHVSNNSDALERAALPPLANSFKKPRGRAVPMLRVRNPQATFKYTYCLLSMEVYVEVS